MYTAYCKKKPPFISSYSDSDTFILHENHLKYMGIIVHREYGRNVVGLLTVLSHSRCHISFAFIFLARIRT